MRGAVERFEQIAPNVLFAVDGYHSSGKTLRSLEKLAAIVAERPSIRKVVLTPYAGGQHDLTGIRDAQPLSDLAPQAGQTDPDFRRLPFDHPLYVLLFRYKRASCRAPAGRRNRSIINDVAAK